ncbi:UV DNA damage repair endonuclease UvsE [Bacillus sp. ISL-40]|uniref:UV DNA damage repair endonuclease UvsE n=1 Tax=unclassified Bacillus (in: firmicutes) TaxID=185979 RepID=UPI001BEB504B|nr:MULTISPECIES: UV DNA damage repair endonuclease UvsE [unclassified Bacillus (in: firmicutes)]MBT2699769.1 UV DNA damage repair endonuclease UvsE [Bacillus sp. ISL-40]MBT2722218.1 UV DNA damage repair endonuclease UvsE [Bacillus sp. ISL-46]MBT2740637.1 UV DNA damage repair endonuclease UvsE [Bacillus sp. ISL-77]
MTIVKLGYVAMSVELQNASPSQTMTFAQFEKIKDRDAAIRKLERIAISNLENCLRLLKHNEGNQIHFFRLSSRVIPLANHEELLDWDYIKPLKEPLKKLANYIKEHPSRIDFHPDHFVVLNSPNKDILINSLKTLAMHERLLKGMEIDTEHRCVLHVGGGYNDKEKALEYFIHNWAYVSPAIQKMIMLENDDTTFTIKETLYLCEKLGLPMVFDYHHHLANHEEEDWTADWERIVATWTQSPLPIKIHISSPRSEKDFRAHADTIDPQMFLRFLNQVKGTVPEIHCMIEAKQKDAALFQLVKDLQEREGVTWIDQSSFIIE